MSECGIECDLAGDGVFFVIGNGGAFIYFSPTWRGSGDEEKRTYELRLPCVAMSNDRKVADLLRSIGFHKGNSFLSGMILAKETHALSIKAWKIGRVSSSFK